MRACPETDAIVTIARALDWDVAEGLRHLQACGECRATIDALQLTRSALAETEAIDDATLARISALVRAEARRERPRGLHVARWASIVEAVLAGVAAPIVLVSSGIELGSTATGALTSVLGAAFLLYGRRLRLYDG
jgi:predicted anti-sigma-YlaC factor YlaD